MNDTDLLARQVSGLLSNRSEEVNGQRVEQICRILGLDRPEIANDPAFPVLMAVALSPESAIRYHVADPRPRWTYIQNYLKQFAALDERQTETSCAATVQNTRRSWNKALGSKQL